MVAFSPDFLSLSGSLLPNFTFYESAGWIGFDPILSLSQACLLSCTQMEDVLWAHRLQRSSRIIFFVGPWHPILLALQTLLTSTPLDQGQIPLCPFGMSGPKVYSCSSCGASSPNEAARCLTFRRELSLYSSLGPPIAAGFSASFCSELITSPRLVSLMIFISLVDELQFRKLQCYL